MPDLPRFDLTPEGVQAALADLDKGGSEDVAMRLQELGIRGVRGNECGCPVANYLGRVLGADTVMVSRGEVFAYGTAYEDWNGFPQPLDLRLHADLPDSVSAFVEDFDQGIYPELVDSTEVTTDA